MGRRVVGGGVLGDGADVQEVDAAYSTTNATARATNQELMVQRVSRWRLG